MTYEIQQAINLGNQITEYLASSMIENYGKGNRSEADQHQMDCCLVRSLVEVLEFYQSNGEDTGLTISDILGVISKINEYEGSLLLDIEDFAVQVGSDADALGGVNSVIVIGNGSTVPVVHSYSFVVDYNEQTIFTMPFNVSQVDTDSLYLTLNDAINPEYGTDYSITGNTMSWSGDYPLSAGWTFELKYWL